MNEVIEVNEYPRIAMTLKVAGVIIAIIALNLIVDVGRDLAGAPGRTLHIFSLWLMNSYIMLMIWLTYKNRK